jgi:hypothetical protein
MSTMTRENRIMIYGPKTDETFNRGFRDSAAEAKAAALVWKQRFEPRASTGKGEEYKITHGWVMALVNGGKMKRQFSVYHGKVDAQLADRRHVSDAPTLAEAKDMAEADNSKRQAG